MVFKDILNKFKDSIELESNNLLDLAYKNQTFESDVLMLHINGFINEKSRNLKRKKVQADYYIGADLMGWAEATQFRFIDFYLEGMSSKISHSEHLKNIENSKGTEEEEWLVLLEMNSIQTDMLLYIKIWEMTSFLKYLYQFNRLLNAKEYDWHFKLKPTPYAKGTATTKEILEDVWIKELESLNPHLFSVYNSAYNRQIRNAIAHSDFSMLNRCIQFHNKRKEDELDFFTFDEWYEIFHSTLVIYLDYRRVITKISNDFAEKSRKEEIDIPLRLTKSEGSTILENVYFREEWKDWRWSRNKNF